VNKKLLFAAELAFIITLLTLLIYPGTGNKNKNAKVKKRHGVTATIKPNKKIISSHKSIAKLNLKIVPEEKNPLVADEDIKTDESEKDKVYKKDNDKFDKPEKFVEFETRIRRLPGKSTSDYPPNYKMMELTKAVNKKFNVSLSKYNSSFKQLQSGSLPWIERGPGNVTGRTRGLIIDPDDSTGNTWFAGSVGGGIWKTTDGGKSWVNKTPAFPDLATTTIAMAPSNHNIIYAGTGEGFFNVDAVAGDGIFKSTDRGETWNQLVATAGNVNFQSINRIVVNPSNPNLVYVCANVDYNAFNLGTYSNIFKSTDGGINWLSVYNNKKARVQQLLMNPKNSNTIYATVNGTGVIKSLDGGQTWNLTKGIKASGRVEIAIAPTDTTRMYASVELYSNSSLFISDDAGSNWVPVDELSGSSPDWLNGQGWYDNTLAVNPYFKDTLFVGGVNVYKIGLASRIDTSEQITSSVSSSENFLSFMDWGGDFFDGGGGIGSTFLGEFGVVDSDYVSVEIRFGPGISQKAHRFVRVASSAVLKYKDYISVPFEVWDVTNHRQLMASFWDWDKDSAFNLVPYVESNVGREYIFINKIPYDSLNPSPNLAVDNGEIYKNIYGIWPILADNVTWDPNNLPVSTLNINFQRIFAKTRNTTQLTNWYSGAGFPYTHADHHNLNIFPINQAGNIFKILDPNDGGMSVSDNSGKTWSQITSYQTTQFYGADKNPAADQYLGGMQDNGTWYSGLNPNSGNKYTFFLGGDGFAVDWKYDDPKQFLGSLYNNQIYKTTDGGNSIIAANTGFTDWGSYNSPFITSIAKTNEDPDLIFASSTSGAWRSDNFGDSWTLTPLYFKGSDYNITGLVAISLSNPQIVWTAANTTVGYQIAVSKDGGLSFTYPVPDTKTHKSSITGIATHPTQDSTAFILLSIAQSPKILRTTNLGKTWTDISGFSTGTSSTNGFPDVAVYCLLVMPTNPNIIWAGTEIGLFESTDSGNNWALAGNGLPSVSIWDMKIVGNQIVVATHGRGIWSVNPPWLSGYTLPTVIKSPRLNTLSENPNGSLVISYSLRSAYDSSIVIINSKQGAKLNKNNTVLDSALNLPVTASAVDSVQVISYKSGGQYKSSIQFKKIDLLQAARNTYSNDFNKTTNDFSGTGLSIFQSTGFSSPAIQSVHPYSDNSESIYQLLVPIVVASANAVLSYDDVAIVEPANPGAVFGTPDFNDYVVVEGSLDGSNWIPLAAGYNSRSDNAWLNAFNAGMEGDSTMFRHHNINILNTFSAGQKILIRFRLHSDANTHGYGWVIDNLGIQSTATKINDNVVSLPKEFNLAQNYPNPFNPSTTIKYSVPYKGVVKIQVFDILGKVVATLVNEEKPAGFYSIEFNGSRFASGVYFYRIAAGEFTDTKKMIMMK
jgi:photosystem II stability/assembly factor-like uncharacterized protein